MNDFISKRLKTGRSPRTCNLNVIVLRNVIKQAIEDGFLPASPIAGLKPLKVTTPIADIQNNLRQYKGTSVTVEGQIYIPTNYRGTTTSGYIQDGSGRGINLFGGSIQGPVNQLGAVAKVTGTVEIYFATIEITGYTATLVAADQPHLGARVLSVAEANSSQWEGTYMETTADLTSIQASGAGIYNYTAAETSG